MAHIFLEHKLPVSGYLVAWQYYMNTGDVCTNTSYAAIIRRDGNKYTMIARTLLTPEDSTNAGIRFQFIQNNVIRVQKGDLIAIHTEEGKNSPCGAHLVSGNPSGRYETMVADLGIDFELSQTLTLLDEPDSVDVALKAYVSGILFYSVVHEIKYYTVALGFLK